MSAERPAVLFVCLGNICRSPLAEAAFRHEAEKAGLSCEIDSAGTSNWEAGSPPDPRAQATARSAGIDISGYVARQVERDDFARFTHILAMDAQNLADLKAKAPVGSRARISLLLDCVPGREGAPIADPYYGGEEDFAATWKDAVLGARALVRELTRA